MFFNVQFKITECDDEVYSSDSEDDENKEDNEDEGEDSEMNDQSSESEKPNKNIEDIPQFPKTFIFSCIGVGLTNISRKAE